ncbi:MAG: DoxX family protein [bacterium]
MFKKLLKTDEDIAWLILRVILGIIIFPHGAQKLLGWFDGYGFSNTIGFFKEPLGIPAIFGILAIVAEFFGSLGLISGLLTRVAAFGISMNMVMAILLVHLKVGFFMNWSGKQAGEGYEYHLLVLAITLVLMIKGGGKWSLDGILKKKRIKG